MTDHASAADLLLRRLSDRRPGTGDRGPATTDWNEVVDIAADAGLAPLLFRRLKQSGARAWVPADGWRRLRKAYLESAGEGMRLHRELGPVLQSLRSSGIRVIALKGAYLAEAVYGDVALRPMHDVDLLVPTAELPGAAAVLRGMSRVHEPTEDTESHNPMHLPPFAIGDLSVELHWTIVYPTGPVVVDATGLWDRARPANVAGVEVLSLCPEDLLLNQCLHLCYHHGCIGLRYLCDIAETVQRFSGDTDWAQVAHRAEEWGATRYVGLALHLAARMLDAEVPDDALERLVPGGLDPEVLEVARKTVLAGIPYDKWLSPAFLGLRGHAPLTQKVKRLWKRVFLSREAMASEYPASRNSRHLYGYHARRLWFVIRKWGPALGMMPGHKWEQNLSGSTLLADWLRSGKP